MRFRIFELTKVLCLAAVALLLGAEDALSAATSSPFQRIQERGTLIVAQFGGERLPFFMQDPDGNLDGFDVQLARDIADELGVKLEINRDARSFDQVVDYVLEGKADIAISKLSVTLKRAERVVFTKPYITLHQGLLINRLRAARVGRGSSPMAVCNAEDAQIGVIGGTSYVGFARELFPLATVIPFSDFPSLLDAAKKGEIMAILYDEMEIKKILRAQPDVMIHLRLVIFEDREDPLAIAVAPADQQLRDWLNLYLELRRVHPTVESLLNRFPPVNP